MIFEVKYISEEEWVALGKPAWGYTTARIRQYERDTLPFKEIMLEYYRAAVLFTKLAKTMNWWEETDEYRLSLCRKEIEHFKKANNLTKGDLAEIDEIAYHAEYSRKQLVKNLTHLARDIFEIKKKAEKDPNKKITLDSIAKIPANRIPKLEYAKPVNREMVEIDNDGQEENQENQESGDTAIEIISPFACSTHQNYKGLRKPRSGCLGCIRFYSYNKQQKN